jgi:putative endonuclease
MKNRFWVYIVASKSGTLYTGMTNNLDRRIAEHKQRAVPGFTAKHNCTRLLWLEEHSDVRDAIAREKQIKGWLRAKKIALIESLNPHWEDLAEHLGAEMSLQVTCNANNVQKFNE